MLEREFWLRTGPFTTHLTTTFRAVAEGVELLYGATERIGRAEFSDFHVAVTAPLLRHWVRPKAQFFYEGHAPFDPAPANHALPMFEWGLNWVIGTTITRYLLVHAAVVERGGRALLMPGAPGSGKSTLCAGLAHRGWRLLSDELALLRPDGCIDALARPISLKNESIDVFRRFAPDVPLSRPAFDTSKGTVVLARAPAESVHRAGESAQPGWLVFPRYEAGAPPTLTPRGKASALMELINNAVNYAVLGAAGFTALADLVEASQCFDFVGGDLAASVDLLNSGLRFL